MVEEAASERGPRGTDGKSGLTWCGRRLDGGVAPGAGSCGAPSGQISRSAVLVCDFLTGAGLSMLPPFPLPSSHRGSSLLPEVAFLSLARRCVVSLSKKAAAG